MKLFEFVFHSMTTPCRVKLYADNENMANECFDEIKFNTLRLEKKYNFYNNKSYLSRVINRRKRNQISLDNETYNILKTVRLLSEAIGGLFDITVGTAKECYSFKSIKRVESCIKKKMAFMGLGVWSLEENMLVTKSKLTLFDLGGVVKEYAVDEAAKIAKKHCIEAVLINYGGDIYAYGLKPSGEQFSIGIKNPKNPQENIAVLPLEDQALTTSAGYERNTKVEGREFSHIIGSSLDTSDIVSATIISDSALKSGVYSTTFMLTMDVDIPDGMGVMLIDDRLRLHQNLVK
ncbi:MAG: FAD:protein FMN transferase [Sulfurovum sp.]|nr:FAD:protein FMN transferase [Sulfurovum sp.]